MKSGLIVLVIVFLIVSFIFIGVNYFQGGKEMGDKLLYQGPVPEGYDEEYFRETGITKPLEE